MLKVTNHGHQWYGRGEEERHQTRTNINCHESIFGRTVFCLLSMESTLLLYEPLECPGGAIKYLEKESKNNISVAFSLESVNYFAFEASKQMESRQILQQKKRLQMRYSR